MPFLNKRQLDHFGKSDQNLQTHKDSTSKKPFHSSWASAKFTDKQTNKQREDKKLECGHWFHGNVWKFHKIENLLGFFIGFIKLDFLGALDPTREAAPPCTISSALLGGPTPGHRCQRRAISQHRWGLWNKNAFWQSNKNLESTSQKKIENPLKSGAGDFYKFLGMAGPLAIKLRSKWKWKASFSRCNLYLKKSRQKKTGHEFPINLCTESFLFPFLDLNFLVFSQQRVVAQLIRFPTFGWSHWNSRTRDSSVIDELIRWSGWKGEDTVDGNQKPGINSPGWGW